MLLFVAVIIFSPDGQLYISQVRVYISSEIYLSFALTCLQEGRNASSVIACVQHSECVHSTALC
jgi:hypothetical protein